MRKIFSVLFIVVTAMVTAQESALLRVNYKKGETYLTKIKMKQDLSIAETTMKMDMLTKVKEVIDTTYKVEISFDKVLMEANQMGMSIKYDSSVKEEDMSMPAKGVHSRMKPMLTMIIGMNVNTFGKTSDMKFIKGEGNLEQVMQNNTAIEYPKEAVKVGTKWTQSSTSNGVKMNTNYTVKSITPTTVVLNVEGKASELATGTITGNVEINRKLGIPTKTEMVLDLETMGQKIKTDLFVTMEKN